MSAAECLDKLIAYGWTFLAVFRCPAVVLSDWFRERGHDDTADALAAPRCEFVCKLRDECYMRAPWGEQRDGIRQYVREVVGTMPELEANANQFARQNEYRQEYNNEPR